MDIYPLKENKISGYDTTALNDNRAPHSVPMDHWTVLCKKSKTRNMYETLLRESTTETYQHMSLRIVSAETITRIKKENNLSETYYRVIFIYDHRIMCKHPSKKQWFILFETQSEQTNFLLDNVNTKIKEKLICEAPPQLREPATQAKETLKDPNKLFLFADSNCKHMPPIVAQSNAMRSLEKIIKRIVAFPWHIVLLMGETGTGKELFARALHELS